MDAFAEPHLADDRFSAYVEELHEFSASHRIPCGKPEDLAGLVEALKKSPAFATDFGSMMRSIVLREHFRAGEAELLTLLAVAWGGVQTDDPPDDLPLLLRELRGILQDLLRRGTMGTLEPLPPVEDSDEGKDAPAEAGDTIQKVQDGNGDLSSANHRPVSGERTSYAQEKTIAVARKTTSGSRESVAPRVVDKLLLKEEAGDKPAGLFAMYNSEETKPAVPVRRLEPSAGEIVAAGLTGLVVALMFTVGSLPVYRSRVSVDLPATATSALRSGELTGRVAERLLAQPHPNPLLRQDTLSRGMRDLHLGGTETILYADLVAETAHEVKMRRLESQNVYEITCESWSPQFAATFCNELLDVLHEQQGGESIRTIDAATEPGVQVFPHWYLQSLGGLAVGCLVGISFGFVKRTVRATDGEGE